MAGFPFRRGKEGRNPLCRDDGGKHSGIKNASAVLRGKVDQIQSCFR